MVYIFIAEGFEEVEAVTVIDCLRRCDIKVILVAVGNVKDLLVTGSHGIQLKCDIPEQDIDIEISDMIILPGGMPGTTNLKKSEHVSKYIDYCYQNGKYIAAICAAPIILAEKQLINNKDVTCYPSFERSLIGDNVKHQPVCVSDRIITARSAYSSFDFSFIIISCLKGEDIVKKLKADLLCNV